MNQDKPTLWQRLRAKYRVAVINETTLGEIMHLRLSLLYILLGIIALTIVTLVLFALLIWYTPLKNYLPGYNQNMRQELMEENSRVDSLLNVLTVQQEYLTVMRNVVAGEIETDSLQPLDSLYEMRREELLAEQSAITADFITAYETSAHDNLTLFDQAVQNDNLQTLIRPAGGVIVLHYGETDFPGLRVQTPSHENVLSILSGTVVSASYNLQNGWTVMVQHDADYLSIYSGLEKTICSVGQTVKAGESLAIASGEKPIGIQLWQRGRAIDPETVIAF